MQMKKDRIKDYATAAFRDYAAAGFKNSQPEADLCVLLDRAAVERTIEILTYEGKGDIIAAVKAVYFVGAREPIRKGTITSRVRRFSTDLPCSEMSAYRYLREARRIFAVQRGLTCDE